MPDSVRRALRTFLQIGVVQAGIQLYQAFAVVPLNAPQVVAITTFVTPFVALAQNLLEDSGVLPSLLKAPAAPADADGVVTIMAPMDRPGELTQVPRPTYDALVAEGYPTIESGVLRVVSLPPAAYERQRVALAGG